MSASPHSPAFPFDSAAVWLVPCSPAMVDVSCMLSSVRAHAPCFCYSCSLLRAPPLVPPPLPLGVHCCVLFLRLRCSLAVARLLLLPMLLAPLPAAACGYLRRCCSSVLWLLAAAQLPRVLLLLNMAMAMICCMHVCLWPARPLSNTAGLV